jgi:hypothetical protein
LDPTLTLRNPLLINPSVFPPIAKNFISIKVL